MPGSHETDTRMQFPGQIQRWSEPSPNYFTKADTPVLPEKKKTIRLTALGKYLTTSSSFITAAAKGTWEPPTMQSLHTLK